MYVTISNLSDCQKAYDKNDKNRHDENNQASCLCEFPVVKPALDACVRARYPRETTEDIVSAGHSSFKSHLVSFSLDALH